jgi:hypothetical protein
MKTGGKTLAGLLSQFYRKEDFYGHSSFTGAITSNAPFVWGHVCYDDLPTDSGRLAITLLRQPARRVVSTYQMALRNSTSGLLPEFWVNGKPMTLLDFARVEKMDYLMTRQLCGWDGFRVGQVSEGELDTAIEHLSTMIFGFTESLYEFAKKLCAHFSWDVPMYHNRNVAPPYTTDTVMLAEIERINWADMHLYEWALEHYKTSGGNPSGSYPIQ